MIAFDTNILMYAAHPRSGAKQEIALNLLLKAESGVLLWQVALEFIAASRKLAEYGFTTAEAWDQLNYYRRSFPLIVPTAAVLEQAQRLHVDQQWSFWDAMIVAASLEAGVTRLYSEDLPGQRPPQPLEIINPFA